MGRRPTDAEIEEQINKADEVEYEGMSFSEGVAQALEWVLGRSDEKPFEDE